MNCLPLEKSFFVTELPSSTSDNRMSGPEDDPFTSKSPVNFKKQPKQAKELAVDVRNISYQYGFGRKANKVLNDVTLKVPLGGIYGLLGPSGCGRLLNFFNSLCFDFLNLPSFTSHHYSILTFSFVFTVSQAKLRF